MTRNAIVGITAMTISLCAGSVVAQVRTDDNRRQNQQQQDREQRTLQGQDRAMTQRTNLRLHRAKDLMGSDLNGTDNKSIGTIRDFIVDRGSGEIVFAVVGSGGVMGMGGTQYAIPFEQLVWSENDDAFRTSMTKEQLQSRTALPDDWNNLRDTSWMRNITGWGGDRDSTYATDEAIAAATSRAQAEEIRGRIVSIDRDSERFGSENVVVEIETEEGDRKEVVLGPSWFVSGHQSAPLRGQTVVLKAKEYNGTWYGWSAGERGNELMLRNEDGSPAWRSERDANERHDDTQRRDNRSGAERDRGDSPTTTDSNRGTRPINTTTNTNTTTTTGTRTGATENDSPTTRNSNVGTRSTNPAGGESGTRPAQTNQDNPNRVENESPTTRNSNIGTRSTNPADATDSRRTTQPARTTDRERQTGRDNQADRTRQNDRTPAGAYGGLTTSRYVLMSDLIGADATARGISSGEIQDVVIESGSGKACFLLFDANENFMGIGDDLSLVPWKVAYVSADSTVNIDADASDFSNAMKAPDNFEDIRSSAALAAAYSAFNTRPDAMRERSMRNDRMHNRDDANRMNERERLNERDRTNDRDRDNRQDRPRGTGNP